MNQALEHIQNHEKIKVIERVWRSQLSPPQHAVVSFIADRTLGWNREWEIITIREFVDGVVNEETGEVEHYGINLSKRSVQNALKDLVAIGYILKRDAVRWMSAFNEYALNPEKLAADHALLHPREASQ